MRSILVSTSCSRLNEIVNKTSSYWKVQDHDYHLYSIINNFKEWGFNIIPSDEMYETNDIAAVIVVDDVEWASSLFEKFTNQTKFILIHRECKLINPLGFDYNYIKSFDVIVTFDKESILKTSYSGIILHKYSGRFIYEPKDCLNILNRKKKFVLVCKNQKMKSDFELYTKREEVINFFENNPKYDFDLYGPDWDRKIFNNQPLRYISRRIRIPRKLTNWKGIVDNKREVLKNSQFCFCFENSAVEGYITEKLFDCFKAAVIPIYRGAPNVENIISPDSFINAEKFKTIEELVNFCVSLSDEKKIQYIKNGKKALLDSIKLFDANKITREIYDHVR